jgi:hypothetical protein
MVQTEKNSMENVAKTDIFTLKIDVKYVKICLNPDFSNCGSRGCGFESCLGRHHLAFICTETGICGDDSGHFAFLAAAIRIQFETSYL